MMMYGHALNAAASCESLSSLVLPNTSITLAQMVPAGGFTLPGMGPATVQQFSRLPAFCRVAATLTPSSDSDIKIEVWLPALAWNGKFQAVGNGGWAGAISYGALASALQEGYATASTDTGHTGGNASFAIGHREKVIDFAYRAVHEMAVKSKTIIAAFYDRAARFSYWTGCSTGGGRA
jgi:feruloyl esterase